MSATLNLKFLDSGFLKREPGNLVIGYGKFKGMTVNEVFIIASAYLSGDIEVLSPFGASALDLNEALVNFGEGLLRCYDKI